MTSTVQNTENEVPQNSCFRNLGVVLNLKFVSKLKSNHQNKWWEITIFTVLKAFHRYHQEVTHDGLCNWKGKRNLLFFVIHLSRRRSYHLKSLIFVKSNLGKMNIYNYDLNNIFWWMFYLNKQIAHSLEI